MSKEKRNEPSVVWSHVSNECALQCLSREAKLGKRANPASPSVESAKTSVQQFPLFPRRKPFHFFVRKQRPELRKRHQTTAVYSKAHLSAN